MITDASPENEPSNPSTISVSGCTSFNSALVSQVPDGNHAWLLDTHALVRFVTRTNTSLNAALLETLDREAVASLTQLSNNSLKGNDLESYPIAKQFDGLWPSEIVETTGEDGWPKDKQGSTPKIRTLRVRTFLSPEEMSGGIYLIWKGDPKLSYSKSA